MANNTLCVTLTDAQMDALEIMDLTSKGETLAKAALSSAIKGKLNYYRNGQTVNTASEATHSVTKRNKAGVEKIVYYNGGLADIVGAAYEMARKYLPKDLTKQAFVAAELEKVDAIIARISAAETDTKAEETDTKAEETEA